MKRTYYFDELKNKLAHCSFERRQLTQSYLITFEHWIFFARASHSNRHLGLDLECADVDAWVNDVETLVQVPGHQQLVRAYRDRVVHGEADLVDAAVGEGD